MKRFRLLSAAAICFAVPATLPAQTTRSISASDRAQGSQANPELVAQFGGRYDGSQAAFVERVGKRVSLQSGLSNASGDFTVQLLNSPVENAFAIPGGYVYVTRQLLALMNSEDELAFVMGHEVGHVAARHSAGRQRTSTIGGVLAGIVGAVAGNSNFGSLLGRGAQQAAGLYALKYGRDQEYQADTLGVRYVAGAGYNPYGAPLILNQLGAETALEARVAGRDASATPTWLSTHPSSADRVARARALAQQAGRGGPATGQDVAFLRMLDGMRYDDDPAQGVIDGQTFRHPQMRIRFTAPAGYTIANASDAVTVAGQRGQAQLTMGSGDPAAALTARFRTLGGQVSADQVRDVTINGRRAATATITATANNSRVDATVVAIAFPTGTYVWTVATPAGSGVGALAPVIDSFTTLSASEAAAIKGRRIRIATVRAGDTIDSLARQMDYPNFQRERFLTLNGLDANAALRPGMLVKLVVTG
ncbi:M48 family metalloprotease [Sphingomonas donggukensis]|uniref:M48 family metalloprotease n=1 Tax=Sphingomonas donggukensis TaxID=2949093 RepID=A0ABY4TRQ9_9SPHN|nr:M48 family metalloprotease [Sphingomonas donggukensis]URW74932.1 M48 family metalloprotease [Sphingomonas donggukensis]